jgi:hypothetical protein
MLYHAAMDAHLDMAETADRERLKQLELEQHLRYNSRIRHCSTDHCVAVATGKSPAPEQPTCGTRVSKPFYKIQGV